MNPQKTFLKVIIQNIEQSGFPNVSFTGDALRYCGEYLKDADRINLDDWIWYKETRGDQAFYIVTDLKNLTRANEDNST